MALTFGFYNSMDGDRKYDAEQMSSLFDGIIEDGVYMAIGEHMNVTAGPDLTVLVGTGRAWFDHTWTLNDSKLTLAIPTPEAVESRIDAVVLEVDHTDDVRANSIKIIEGNPSSDNPQRPQLTRTDYRNQYALAYISVAPNAKSITQANITNNVGMSDCPFVTGAVQNMVIDDLIAQWQTQWDEYVTAAGEEAVAWRKQHEADFQEWSDEQKENYTTWVAAEQQKWTDWSESNWNTFDEWFQNIKTILSGDVAGNLQNQIDEIVETEFNRYYSMINKNVTISRDDDDNVQSITETSDEGVSVTTFQETESGKVITTNLTPTDGEYKYVKTTSISRSGANTVITESFEKLGK